MKFFIRLRALHLFIKPKHVRWWQEKKCKKNFVFNCKILYFTYLSVLSLTIFVDSCGPGAKMGFKIPNYRIKWCNFEFLLITFEPKGNSR